MIYVAIFLALILMRWSLAGSPKLRDQIYVVLLFAMFLFSAFRFEVGCDWSGYLSQYYTFSRVPLSEIWNSWEPLWVGIFAIQHWLGLPYPWVNVFSSAIFFLGAHALARRQPDPFAFLIFLFPVLIVNMPMSGIRQATAIGVMFFAFNAYSDRSLVRYLVLTLVASGLHSSALVFLLLTPMVTGHFTRGRLLLSAVLAVPGALLILAGEAAERATNLYIGTEIDAAGAAFRVGVMTLSGVYFFAVLRRRWQLTFPGDWKLAITGALLMLGIIVLVPISTVIGDRLAYFLIPIQAVIFARIPYLPWRRDRAVHTALPYVVLLLLFIAWTSLSWHFQRCYIPYDTWLFGLPEHLQY